MSKEINKFRSSKPEQVVNGLYLQGLLLLFVNAVILIATFSLVPNLIFCLIIWRSLLKYRRFCQYRITYV